MRFVEIADLTIRAQDIIAISMEEDDCEVYLYYSDGSSCRDDANGPYFEWHFDTVEEAQTRYHELVHQWKLATLNS